MSNADLRDLLLVRLLRSRTSPRMKDIILRQLWRAFRIPNPDGAREGLLALAAHYGIPSGVAGA
jgi:hypothetical protein